MARMCIGILAAGEEGPPGPAALSAHASHTRSEVPSAFGCHSGDSGSYQFVLIHLKNINV